MKNVSKETWRYIRIGAEYAGLILLFCHLLPEQLVTKGKENGLAAIIFLGAICILLIISNWKSAKHHRFELEVRKQILENATKEKESLQSQLEVALQKSKYTLLFPYLNKAFSTLHDTISSQKTEQEYKSAFQDFCTHLSHAFKELNGRDYHVCIKIPIQLGKNNNKIAKLKAKTLVRGTIGNYRDNVDNQPIEHLFQHNTDYEYIFNNIRTTEGRFFMSNNLPEMVNYRNSSFQAKAGSTFQYSRADEAKGEWPLPYKSCITAAICPGVSSQRHSGTLIGFLCIDNMGIDSFDKTIDTEIIAGCADGLYNSLKTYMATQIYKKPIS